MIKWGVISRKKTEKKDLWKKMTESKIRENSWGDPKNTLKH